MGVLADEQRPRDALGGPVFDDRLGGGRDVGLVERRLERRAAVPGRAEGDLLVRVGRIGDQVVVRRDQGVDVGEVAGERALSCSFENHAPILPCPVLAPVRLSLVGASGGAGRPPGRSIA